MDWWQRLSGSREGCFLDPGSSKVDASVVCHEVRCFDLGKDEKSWISLRDLNARDREQFATCGEAIHMKSLQLDTTLLVRTWASSSDVASERAKRVCGEVRIPLHRLISRCSSCLYYTWLLLDRPGLNDSMADVGGMFGARDEFEAFDQALLNGPRQLHEQGLCLSIVKTTALPQSGRILWTEDLPPDARVAFWGSLLRSQQQHMVMVKAQNLQQNHKGFNDPSPFTREDFESIREELRNTTSSLEAERQMNEEKRNAEIVRLKEKIADLESIPESSRLQPSSRQYTDELEALRNELETVSREANCKIDAANERIRAVRKERDDALEKTKELEAEMQESVGQMLISANNGNRLHSIAEERSQALADLERVQQENWRLSEQCAQASSKIERLENTVHERTSDVAKQQDQVKVLENTIKAKQEQLNIALTRQNELQELETRDNAQRSKGGMEATFGSTLGGQTTQLNDAARGEIETLRAKLDEISTEANKKIDAANERIRAVKRERDDCKQENELLKAQQAHLAASIEAQDGQSRAANEARSEVRALEQRDIQRVDEIQRLKDEIARMEVQYQPTARVEVNDHQMKELTSLRAANQENQAELASLKRLFDSIQTDGKQHMGSLTDQLRNLIQEREEYRQEAHTLREAEKHMKQNMAGLQEENAALIEQKEALMGIVEDLHQSCMASDVPALQDAGRVSMQSVRNLRALTPRGTPRGTPRLTPRGSFSLK